MQWNEIVGQSLIKEKLQSSVEHNRISHSQLFIGKEGYGGLPIVLAYCREILSKNSTSGGQKLDNLSHIDVHFSFPTYSESGKSVSQNFYQSWREMILENPYSNMNDWTERINSDKKQILISVHEIENIIDKFKLKSFEGGYKILIIFGLDKMNVQAANKFLKFLEEPPEKTIILLLAENIDFVLPTILSRCQTVNIPSLSHEDIENALIERFKISDSDAKSIAFRSQGDWNLALKLLKDSSIDLDFESMFILWVRSAFQAKSKLSAVKDISLWSREISSWGKEKQRNFINYCSEIFRLAILQNYNAEELVYNTLSKDNFRWESFSNFIHGANIEPILEELSLADLQLRRNANAKIIWLDMGMKLTRYIHRSI